MTAQAADPADLTAAELHAAYRSRELSPVTATQAVLDRIAAEDAQVNAYRVVFEAEALEQAQDAEERWLRGSPLGPLDGVPTSIKDVLLTEGVATLRGSRSIDPEQPWLEDAPSVARLRESGAVLVGKTTTPEFAWKGVTDCPLTGITRNPRDISKTSGGSSGGAAAAVAAGMGPIAIGTDGGGSVRIPASFCGVVAIKPTYGAIPLYPASPFGTLAHVGPITRTVEDAALAMDVLTGSDYRDWSALPAPTQPFHPGPETTAAGLRIGYSRDFGYVEVDPEVAELVDAAVAKLAELGAQVEAVDPGFTDPVEAFECLWFAGAAKVTEHLTEAQRAQLDPDLAAACEQGRGYSASDYLEATAVRMALGVTMGRFHERFDLLVTPTMPITAFDAELQVPPGRPGTRWTSWTPFTYPFNMTQQPAISIPCGSTRAGLPVGLQLVGPRHGDHRVLAAAKAFQDAVG